MKFQFPANLKKANRGPGRTEGTTDARGDFGRYVTALMRSAERQLKKQGVWAFRLKAQPFVRDRLIDEGYDKKFVEKLNLMSTRPRGKKRRASK